MYNAYIKQHSCQFPPSVVVVYVVPACRIVIGGQSLGKIVLLTPALAGESSTKIPHEDVHTSYHARSPKHHTQLANKSFDACCCRARVRSKRHWVAPQLTLSPLQQRSHSNSKYFLPQKNLYSSNGPGSEQRKKKVLEKTTPTVCATLSFRSGGGTVAPGGRPKRSRGNS